MGIKPQIPMRTILLQSQHLVVYYICVLSMTSHLFFRGFCLNTSKSLVSGDKKHSQPLNNIYIYSGLVRIPHRIGFMYVRYSSIVPDNYEYTIIHSLYTMWQLIWMYVVKLTIRNISPAEISFQWKNGLENKCILLCAAYVIG